MAEKLAADGYRSFEIRFDAMIGDQPFDCASTYQMGSPPTEARPNHLRLFLSDVSLGSGGEAVRLILDENPWQGNFDDVGHNVVLLDYDDATGNCTFTDEDTNGTVTGWAPGDRTYDAISFRVGVPGVLNHLEAGYAPPPLNRPGMWWSWKDGHVTLRAEFDTPNHDKDRLQTPDDAATPGGWALWLAATPFGECVAHPEHTFTCPDEQQVIATLNGFDPSSDRVELDLGELLRDVDMNRTEYDPWPEEGEPSVTDPTITPYPMPDYYAGFFMDRVDGEGALIVERLGLDWMTLSPPVPSAQTFARVAP
jgi:uncharacterized repeat protein (TIGR04052 family)